MIVEGREGGFFYIVLRKHNNNTNKQNKEVAEDLSFGSDTLKTKKIEIFQPS